MLEPTTEATYSRNLTALAEEAFARHELRHSGGDRWTIQRRTEAGGWTGIYMTEVVAVARCRLLVHGDVSAVLLDTGEADPAAQVRWAAARSPSDFLRHAASDTRALCETADGEVAAGTLLQRVADAIEEYVCDWAHDDHEDLDRDSPHVETDTAWLTLLSWFARIVHEVTHPDKQVARWLESAARLLRGDPLEEVRASLFADDEDPENLYDLGDVPDARVFYARAALRRLVVLLDAEAAPAPSELARG